MGTVTLLPLSEYRYASRRTRRIVAPSKTLDRMTVGAIRRSHNRTTLGAELSKNAPIERSSGLFTHSSFSVCRVVARNRLRILDCQGFISNSVLFLGNRSRKGIHRGVLTLDGVRKRRIYDPDGLRTRDFVERLQLGTFTEPGKGLSLPWVSANVWALLLEARVR